MAVTGPFEDAWTEALAARHPDLDLRAFRSVADLESYLTRSTSEPHGAADPGTFEPGFHVLVLPGSSPADRILAACPDLRWIQTSSAGIDGIATASLKSRPGIVVTTARGVHGDQMAEHTLALILALTRALPRFLRQQSRHEWKRQALPDLAGRTLLVVGYGTIGERIGALGQAVGLRVIGVRRTAPPSAAPGASGAQVISTEDLDQVLPEADYVVLVLPRTAATNRLMDHARLGLMKPGSFLINVGRGGTVDEDALLAALRDGPLEGAALDVFTEEPLPDASPLWDLPNLIVTPHVAAASPRYFEQVFRLFANNLARFLEEEPLRHVADPARGY